MTDSKISLRTIIVLVAILLGAGTSALYQVIALQEEAPLYQSVGKLAVRSRIPPKKSGEFWESHRKDFDDAVIETLVSTEMQDRALEKACVLNPGLTVCVVNTEVSKPKNSAIFSVRTIGKEPKFTQVFLDVLLDEFLAYRMASHELIADKSDDLALLEHASTAVKMPGDWQEEASSGATTGGVAGLVAGLLLAVTFVRPVQEAQHAPLASESTADSAARKGTDKLPGYRWLVWGFALGAVAGLLIQVLRLTSQPQCFRSLAKVVAVQGLSPQGISKHPVNDNYYGTIIETLESAQMNVEAMSRVRMQNPEVKDHDVSVRVAQTRGSAIFNVLATGSEPKYTKLFLNALLDEFMLFRSRQAEAAGLDPREDVAIHERATVAMEEITDWGVPLFTGTVAASLLGGMFGFFSEMICARRRKQRLAAV